MDQCLVCGWGRVEAQLSWPGCGCGGGCHFCFLLDTLMEDTNILGDLNIHCLWLTCDQDVNMDVADSLDRSRFREAYSCAENPNCKCFGRGLMHEDGGLVRGKTTL